jgi:threonine dehydrogenase-like Zn-dependent dehydrogenase
MKAIKYSGKGEFRVVEIPIPQLKSKEVLIEMKAATICGSDFHIQ